MDILFVTVCVMLTPPVLFVLLVVFQCLRSYFSLLRLSFHPISSIPEPPANLILKMTTGHGLLKLLATNESVVTAETFTSFKRDLGPIYVLRSLFGEQQVFLHSAEAIRRFTLSNYKAYHKSAIIRNSLATLVGHKGIVLAEGEEHKRLRRIVAPALHHDALLAVEETFFEQAEALSELVSKKTENENILNDVRICTFAVIFETCFGAGVASKETIDWLRDAYMDAFIEPPPDLMRRVLLQRLFSFLPPDVFGHKLRLKRDIKRIVRGLCDTLLEDCEDGSTRLLRKMIEEEKESIVTREELVDTVMSFLTAGQATTSMGVCWTFYALGRDSKWQKLLLKELEQWDRADGLEKLDALPLLDRIIKESLRLYPPVCFTSRVLVEEDEIEGVKLPPGTIIRLPILALQIDEDIWGSDAKIFDPDRWLREDSNTRFYWCLFLFGPRACIGQRFAVLEMKAFVAIVLKRFMVSVVEGSKVTSYGAFATPHGMRLKFDQRESVPA